MKKSGPTIALSLAIAVLLWGANNAGTKHLVASWPPVMTGAVRFLCAGGLMLALFRWTRWLGEPRELTRELKWELWWRGGLSLAAYLVCFNGALRLIPASHVALYLGASPVWALLFEGRPRLNGHSLTRYGAATIALVGVGVLFYPGFKRPEGGLGGGELLGLAASVLWTHYGRQSQRLGASLPGPQATAQTLWRAGMMLLPWSLVELTRADWPWRWDLVWIQSYCIVGGSVVAFALWNNALRCWPASRVLLFNNLIPLSTSLWAFGCLHEPMTPTFGLAMVLIVIGVVLGQTDWQKWLAPGALPPE